MKKSFTLLELIVGIFILSLIAGSLGIKAIDILARARFKESVKTIREETEKLQLLALTYSSDMALYFFQEKGNWKLKIESPEAVLKTLQGKVIPLNEVVSIQWEKIARNEALKITACSNGDLRPHAVLEVKGREEKFFFNLIPLSVR